MNQPTPEQNDHSTLFPSLRKMLLATLGLAALTQDEIEKFVNRMVERGEIAEQEGKKLMQEVVSKHKSEWAKRDDEISKRVSAAFERMKVPTKEDIHDLLKKIDDLNAKIDQMTKGE